MKTCIKDLSNGFGFCVRGIAFFYTHKQFWLHAILPIIILGIIYGILGFYIFGTLLPYFLQLLPIIDNFNEWIRWFIAIIYWVIRIGLTLAFLLVFIFLANSFFDLIGAFFFDYMISCFERYYYGLHTPKINLASRIKAIISMVFYSLTNVVLMIPLFLLSFLFPIIGTLFSGFVMGKRMGTTLLFSSISNQALTLSKIRPAIVKNSEVLRGIGISTYFAYCIPLLPLFLLPGFFIAASMFHNEVIQGRTPLSREK